MLTAAHTLKEIQGICAVHAQDFSAISSKLTTVTPRNTAHLSFGLRPPWVEVQFMAVLQYGTTSGFLDPFNGARQPGINPFCSTGFRSPSPRFGFLGHSRRLAARDH